MSKFVPKRIKLHHKDNLIPDGTRRCVILGKSESGKTSVLPSILEKLHEFTYLFIFAKNFEDPVYEFLREKYKDKHVFCSRELNPDIILKREDKLKEHKHNVCIIDDFDNKKEIGQKMGFLFQRGRHLNMSTYLIVQNWFEQVPDIIRNNINEVMVFNTSKFPYVAQSLGINEESVQMKQWYNEVLEKPFQFLYVITGGSFIPDVLKIRKNLDGVLTRKIPIV